MHMRCDHPEAPNYNIWFYKWKLNHCLEASEEGNFVIVEGREFDPAGKNWPIIDFTMEPPTADPSRRYKLIGEVRFERVPK